MDDHKLTDMFLVPCCVMEVEKNPDGSCGMIRINSGNQAYCETMGPAYYDNMPYYELVPKDAKFEDFCFRAAFENRRLHAYVETKALNSWTDQQLIPLQQRDENHGRCLFLFEFTKQAEPSRMAEVSMETAELVLRSCLLLSKEENFADSLDIVTKDICTAAGADACRIILIDPEHKAVTTLSDAVSGSRMPGRTPSYEIVKTWEPIIGVSNEVIIKDRQRMTELAELNPSWVKDMQDNNVETLVLIPLKKIETIIGYLYVTNYDVRKTVEVKEMIEVMSFFLGMEIANNQLRSELEYRYTHDDLTGVRSRSAMIALTAQLMREEGTRPFGVVNMDVNGLKLVNDQKGHEAGDQMIVVNVKAMKEIFGSENIYRVGGDEFLAILTGGTKEDFETKVARLRALPKTEGGVNISVGSCWAGTERSTSEALHLADEDMYQEKKQYYKTHTDRRRS